MIRGRRKVVEPPTLRFHSYPVPAKYRWDGFRDPADKFFRGIAKELGLMRGQFKLRHQTDSYPVAETTFATERLFAWVNYHPMWDGVTALLLGNRPAGLGFGDRSRMWGGELALMARSRCGWNDHQGDRNHWLSEREATFVNVLALLRSLQESPRAT